VVEVCRKACIRENGDINEAIMIEIRKSQRTEAIRGRVRRRTYDYLTSGERSGTVVSILLDGTNRGLSAVALMDENVWTSVIIQISQFKIDCWRLQGNWGTWNEDSISNP